MWRSQYLIFLFIGIVSCHPPEWVSIQSVDEIAVYNPESFQFIQDNETRMIADNCNRKEAYFFDVDHPEFSPRKRIRVNVHFINSLDSTANYSPPESGPFGKFSMYHCNLKLDDNKKMMLPIGNETPVHPIPFRYHIEKQKSWDDEFGVYTHFVENPWFVNEGKDKNNYDLELIKPLAIGSDTILNLFFMPHHPDSVASPTYKANDAGIALGTIVKIGYIYNPEAKYWDYATLINHEIGHVLSLVHTWRGNDGCDDTPKHPNCWNTGAPPCDSMVSNNVMDYNSRQNAYTPCQIAKAYSTLQAGGNNRKLVIKDWCEYDSTKTISISDTVIWDGHMDLEGDLVIKEGGVLQINCKVHFPKDAGLYVKRGGTLLLNHATLYNDCNQEWKGIQYHTDQNSSGRVLKNGKIIILNVPEMSRDDSEA